MKPIRLIAMDMDGTLLNSRQELSAGNVAALRAAEEKGVKLAICSGRPAGDSGMFAVTHGFDQMAILSLNGGYCLDRLSARPTPITPSTGKRPCNACNGFGSGK